MRGRFARTVVAGLAVACAAWWLRPAVGENPERQEPAAESLAATPTAPPAKGSVATGGSVAAATGPPASTATVPSWAADAIFYQIFPERFCNGDPSNDPTLAVDG
jgi:hypothetical protein